ncbi:hypothetical protein SUGI_0732520 [Cryptomeria japonica]|uniref:BTB/POZ domain-containing protein At1g03010 n=1 Tax=Cryptomeria japonica TaxID=3369 RepID=UPI0024148B95|nr:BTB/POZ domain-containing protein At1g03010 [Cryptomeria japonica]GLJ36477.1 hypothetical protein SUGI_0732520 [Cryptomeria japonica]
MSTKVGEPFNGWLQRVRRSGEFSDVTVIVNGQEFQLHSLPLVNASTYFRNILCSSTQVKIIELTDLAGGAAAEAFSLAANFCYLLKPEYTFHNVGHIRKVAEFLGMPDLVDGTKKFLYANVFSNWSLSADFLGQYQRVGDVAVDEYIETRCVRAIVNGCTKAFVETKQLRVQKAMLSALTPSPCPSQQLTEILVTVAQLPDRYVQDVIDALVKCHLNLHIKCRQGRNVRGWVDSLIHEECKTNRSRFWVIVCLSRMLQKSCSTDRPWLELSSQYWCSLLENADLLAEKGDLEEEMQEKLINIKSFLEYRIGGSLNELDEYLHCYRFSTQTLVSLVSHFKDKDVGEREREEVSKEVDSCLWSYVDCGSISPSDFSFIFESFPHSFRQSHDFLYTAIQKLVEKHGLCIEDAQMLWRLVDISKLSPEIYDKALKNTAFLCQPHVLEKVLQRHNQELEQMGDGEDNTNRDRNKNNLTHIMEKVIKASLKLLEENSRRSREILELQKQYASLIEGRIGILREECEASPDMFKPV